MFSKEKRFIKTLKTNSCLSKPKNEFRRPKSRSLTKRNVWSDEIYLAELQTLEETTKRLKKKRNEADEERKRLDEEWTALTIAELELQDNFKIFSKFLRENAEKTRRNLRRSEYYTRQIIRRQIAIDRITEVVNIGRIIKDELLEELDKHLIYEKFLTDAAQLLNVKHLISVIQKFQRYVAARDVGTKLSAERFQKIKHFAAEYKRIVFEKHEDVLKMFEKLSTYSENYTEIHAKVYTWEKIVKDIQNYVTKLYLDVEITRGTLEDIVSLQLQRFVGRTSGNILEGFRGIERILETEGGRFVCLKRILRDLEIVKNRISQNIRRCRRTVDKSEGFLVTIVDKTERDDTSNLLMKKRTHVKKRRPASSSGQLPLISSRTARILDDISVKYTGRLWSGRNYMRVGSQPELPKIHGDKQHRSQSPSFLPRHETLNLPILSLPNSKFMPR